MYVRTCMLCIRKRAHRIYLEMPKTWKSVDCKSPHYCNPSIYVIHEEFPVHMVFYYSAPSRTQQHKTNITQGKTLG
jgi:hypothetical protein